MKYSQYCFLLMLIFPSPSYSEEGAPNSEDGKAPILDLENRAISHRKNIDSGILEIDRRLSSFKTGRRELRHEKVKMYVDGDAVRVDSEKPYRGDWKKGETYRESTSKASGVVRFFSTKTYPDGGTRLTQMVPESWRTKVFGVHTEPDLRLIGMAPHTFANLVHYKLNSLLTNPKRGEITERRMEKKNGIDCWRITRGQGDDLVTIWISPEHDSSVIAIERIEGSYRRTVESTLQQVKGYGWFPLSIHVHTYANGKITWEEESDIKVIQFNQKVDGDVFTFKGMSVPIGTLIEILDKQGDTTWKVMGTNGLEARQVNESTSGPGL